MGEQENKSISLRNRRLLLFFVIFINASVLLGIIATYLIYANIYSQKVYEENLNNVGNINESSSIIAQNFLEDMSHKLDDTLNYILVNDLSYDQVIDYLDESNVNPDQQMQIVLSAYYDENDELVYGGYSGISINKTFVGDTVTVSREPISYDSGYKDLKQCLNDLDDNSFENFCITPEFTNDDTKLKCFAIYRHLRLMDNEGITKVYSILLVSNSSYAASVFNSQSNYTGQSTVLINSNGDYLIKNKNFKDTNFFDYLREYNELSFVEANEIKSEVLGLSEGSAFKYIFFKNYESVDCVFCITNMPNDWFTLTVTPISSFNSVVDESSYTLLMVSLFALLFIIDGIVIWYVVKIMRRNILIAQLAKEEASQANVAKSKFLSTMSHELRTPLNAIIGLVSLSGDSIGEPEVLVDYFKKIEDSSNLLLQLISDILDVSAIESNKIKINFNPFNLSKLISSLSSIYYVQCASGGIAFNVVIKNLESDEYIGDSIRLNQILLNFLSNAVKFTPRGGKIDLRIEQVEKHDSLAYIKFDIIDTGCGISDDMKQRLFKPFEQEYSSTARKKTGTGLGLSISKNLIELMDGKVEVESTVGEGSRFTAIIPFGVSDELKNEYGSLSGIRAVIASSDVDICEHVGQMLEHFDVEYTVINNLQNASLAIVDEISRENPYRVCIVNWEKSTEYMESVIKNVRKAFNGSANIIVTLTYDLMDAKSKAIEAGANYVIAKPVFPSELFNVLKAVEQGHVTVVNTKDETFNFTGKRVLLAEDNPLNAEIATLLLKKVHLEVEVATDGKMAYDMFVNSTTGYYNAILMDIQMPILNGYEATVQIRSSEHPQKNIPIIAMTADAFAEDIERAYKAGMSSHLSKPIKPSLLYEMLNSEIK